MSSGIENTKGTIFPRPEKDFNELTPAFGLPLSFQREGD
jgi:hypothetical protein